MNFGDVISLGNHRLMNGDATYRDDVMKLVAGDKVNLVLTDPPYGIKIQNKSGKVGGGNGSLPISPRNPYGRIVRAREYPPMIGDDSPDTAKRNWEIIQGIAETYIIWGGNNFTDFLPKSAAWLFWDKLTGDNDFSDGELAWVSRGRRIRKYTHLWNGICREGNYRLNPKPRVHPTQKPVELHMKILEDFTYPGDVVLDCFGGSGTTLIACEMTGRKCLMMEISPEYCGIIKTRYEDITAGSIPYELPDQDRREEA